MKKIHIEIMFDDKEQKVMTIFNTEGYAKNKLGDQFEIIGVLENMKIIIQDRIKVLLDKQL